MIQGGMGIAAGGNINPRRRRACSSRSAGPRPTTPARRRSTRWRRSARCEMLLAQVGEAEAAARVDRGIRLATSQMKSMRAGEMGFTHGGGRRPGRGGGDGMSADGARPQGGAVRHHAARRRAGHRTVVLDRGPPADPAQDRPAGRALHRRGLARREPARHRVLQARDEGDAAARHAHVVRHDAQGGRAGRGQRGAARAARHRHRGRLPRGQVVGPARHRGAAHGSGRGRRDGARLDRVPARPGPARVLRRRALLRRVPERPAFAMRVLEAAQEAGAERLVLCDTNGGMLPVDVARIVDEVEGAGRGAAGDPRAQRRRVRGRELAHRGGARRAIRSRAS